MVFLPNNLTQPTLKGQTHGGHSDGLLELQGDPLGAALVGVPTGLLPPVEQELLAELLRVAVQGRTHLRRARLGRT